MQRIQIVNCILLILCTSAFSAGLIRAVRRARCFLYGPLLCSPLISVLAGPASDNNAWCLLGKTITMTTAGEMRRRMYGEEDGRPSIRWNQFRSIRRGDSLCMHRVYAFVQLLLAWVNERKMRPLDWCILRIDSPHCHLICYHSTFMWVNRQMQCHPNVGIKWTCERSRHGRSFCKNWAIQAIRRCAVQSAN